MRKFFIKLIALLLLIAGLTASCNPEDVTVVKPRPDRYPMDISYTEYSLEGTGCQWANLNYNDSIIFFNSFEELKPYISCSGNSYPPIDFSKKSLLLISGEKQNGIHEVCVEKFTITSKNRYELNIKVSLNDDKPDVKWCKVLVVNKRTSESIFELNLTTIAYNVEKLWKQPLDVIQATVLGKWLVTENVGCPCFPDYIFPFITHIKKDSVISCKPCEDCFYFGPPISYEWERKETTICKNNYTTFLLIDKETQYVYFMFKEINNDTLKVGAEFAQFTPSSISWALYKCVRLTDK